MSRLPLFAALFSFGTASAMADIVDVRALGDGRSPDIFIAFAHAPNLLETRLDGRVIELEIAEGDVTARRIEPAGNAWITAIETQAIDGREIVRLELSERASNMNVARTRGGLRLTWTVMPGDSPPDVGGMAATETPVPVPEATGAEGATHEIVADASGPAELVATPDDAPTEAAGADGCAAAAAALETDSWNIDALTVQAGCLIADGDSQDAIPLLERVVAFEPGHFDAVIALAEAKEALGELEQAQALYQQAASIAATDGQAVAARARARRLSQSPDS